MAESILTRRRCSSSTGRRRRSNWAGVRRSSLADALSMTIDWYRDFLSGKSAREKCLEQIVAYCAKADRELPHAPATQQSVIPSNR